MFFKIVYLLRYVLLRLLGRAAVLVGLLEIRFFSKWLGIAWLALSVAAFFVGIYEDPVYPDKEKRLPRVLANYGSGILQICVGMGIAELFFSLF